MKDGTKMRNKITLLIYI